MIKKNLFKIVLATLVASCFSLSGLEAQTLSFAEDAELIASFKSNMMTKELETFQKKLQQDSIDYGLTSEQVKERTEMFMSSMCNCDQMYTSVEADPNDPTKKKDRETGEEMISYLQSRTFGPGSTEFTHIVDGDALNCLSDCYNQVDQRNIRNGTVYAWNSVVSNTTILIHLETGKKFWAARTDEACWVADTYYADKACAADTPGVAGGDSILVKYVTDSLYIQMLFEFSQTTGTATLVENLLITVYPNPASDMLFIGLPETQQIDLSNLEFRIYDMSGQAMLLTIETSFSIQDFAPGQYILHIIDHNGDNPTAGTLQFQKF